MKVPCNSSLIQAKVLIGNLSFFDASVSTSLLHFVVCPSVWGTLPSGSFQCSVRVWQSNNTRSIWPLHDETIQKYWIRWESGKDWNEQESLGIKFDAGIKTSLTYIIERLCQIGIWLKYLWRVVSYGCWLLKSFNGRCGCARGFLSYFSSYHVTQNLRRAV